MHASHVQLSDYAAHDATSLSRTCYQLPQMDVEHVLTMPVFLMASPVTSMIRPGHRHHCMQAGSSLSVWATVGFQQDMQHERTPDFHPASKDASRKYSNIVRPNATQYGGLTSQAAEQAGCALSTFTSSRRQACESGRQAASYRSMTADC